MNHISHDSLHAANPQPTTDDATTVEVVTMLGDSVVDVTHVQPRRDRSTKRSTYLLFAGGALLLLLSAVAFGKAVSTAAANKRDKDHWTQVQKKSSRSFTGTTLSLGWDYMAFGGLALGVFAMGWGALRLRRHTAPSSFSIDGAATPLVSERAGEMIVNLPAGMDAELRTTTAVTGKTELAPSFLVPRAGSVRVANGPASFLIRAVATPRRLPTLIARLDASAARFVAGSAAAHAMLLLLLNSVSPDARAVATELGTGDVRLTISSMNPHDTDPPKPDDDKSGDDTLGSDSNGGMAAKAGDPGQAGLPNSTSTGGKVAIKKTSDRPTLSKTDQINIARDAGTVGVIKRHQLFADINSDKWLSSGLDDHDAYGPGTEPGTGPGTFGSYRSGFGPGGGGPDDGLVGTNRNYTTFGPYGPGSDVKTGGPGTLRMDRDPPGGPDVTPLVAKTTPGLDKSIVRRYIQRKLRTIRNCYERELLVHADLAGTLSTVFVIDGNGNVLGASARGMNHAPLHTCVANVLSTIKFPRTEEGQAVTVKYPFRFSRR